VCHIFRTRRPTNFQLGTRRPLSRERAMTSKAKDQGRKVTWSVWKLLAHKSRSRINKNTKSDNIYCRRLHIPSAIKCSCFKAKRSKVKVTRKIITEIKSVSYFELMVFYVRCPCCHSWSVCITGCIAESKSTNCTASQVDIYRPKWRVNAALYNPFTPSFFLSFFLSFSFSPSVYHSLSLPTC